jgi:hypothetical protein
VNEFSQALIARSGYERQGFADVYDRYRPSPPQALLEILMLLVQVEWPRLVVESWQTPGVPKAFASRCYLVYAVAPEGVSAADANHALNAYIEDRRRGLVVFHDHFTGSPHGGIAVLDVRSDEEAALLDDHGPLVGWHIAVHGLTFSLSAVGFAEQTTLTLEEYGKMTFEALRSTEQPDPRFWWRRRAQR